jgi:dephospho-CoA kinase
MSDNEHPQHCGDHSRSHLRIALTGGLGCGKSTVADQFAQYGVTIIDADVIAHTITQPDGVALPELMRTFGDWIITADQRLDRAALRRHVFADPSARQRLEAILHPLIRAQMEEQAQSATGVYTIFVIPLLFESTHRYAAERILVVDTSEALQIARVQARNQWSSEEIKQVLACQVTRETRLAGADDVITNEGSLDALKLQISRLHQRYLHLALQRSIAP